MVKEDENNGGDVPILSFDHDPNCSLSIASLHTHDLIPDSLTRDEEAQIEVVLAPLVVSPFLDVERNVSSIESLLQRSVQEPYPSEPEPQPQ